MDAPANCAGVAARRRPAAGRHQGRLQQPGAGDRAQRPGRQLREHRRRRSRACSRSRPPPTPAPRCPAHQHLHRPVQLQPRHELLRADRRGHRRTDARGQRQPDRRPAHRATAAGRDAPFPVSSDPACRCATCRRAPATCRPASAAVPPTPAAPAWPTPTARCCRRCARSPRSPCRHRARAGSTVTLDASGSAAACGANGRRLPVDVGAPAQRAGDPERRPARTRASGSRGQRTATSCS